MTLDRSWIHSNIMCSEGAALALFAGSQPANFPPPPTVQHAQPPLWMAFGDWIQYACLPSNAWAHMELQSFPPRSSTASPRMEQYLTICHQAWLKWTSPCTAFPLATFNRAIGSRARRLQALKRHLRSDILTTAMSYLCPTIPFSSLITSGSEGSRIVLRHGYRSMVPQWI